jgi:hypothetical protein
VEASAAFSPPLNTKPAATPEAMVRLKKSLLDISAIINPPF